MFSKMESNNTNDYKTVLIVGNGFDLNIGRPTSYFDFMKSVYFEDLISVDKNTLARYLKSKHTSSGKWIDIERELGNYARDLLGLNTDIFNRIARGKIFSEIRNNFRNDFKSLCSALIGYLDEVEREPEQRITIDELASYKMLVEIVNEKNDYHVINFNYTSYIDQFIGFANEGRYEPDYKIHQIHGSLDDNNIVFGLQDSFELPQEYSFLFKSHSKYQDVVGLPHILKSADKIIFFGYSLGETDHSYFEDFFKSQSIHGCDKKRIVFHHYGNEAYDSILWNLKILTNNRLSYLKQHNDVQFINSMDNP